MGDKWLVAVLFEDYDKAISTFYTKEMAMQEYNRFVGDIRVRTLYIAEILTQHP